MIEFPFQFSGSRSLGTEPVPSILIFGLTPLREPLPLQRSMLNVQYPRLEHFSDWLDENSIPHHIALWRVFGNYAPPVRFTKVVLTLRMDVEYAVLFKMRWL